ncbi:MAG: hypothetical protein ABSD68_02555 [Candidatus Micrarchaeales archaeon]
MEKVSRNSRNKEEETQVRRQVEQTIRNKEGDGQVSRQGDLVLTRISKLPAGAIPVSEAILMVGLASGHAHKLSGGKFQVYGYINSKTGEVNNAVVVEEKTELDHPQHQTLPLEEGIYSVEVVKKLSIAEDLTQARRVKIEVDAEAARIAAEKAKEKLQRDPD